MGIVSFPWLLKSSPFTSTTTSSFPSVYLILPFSHLPSPYFGPGCWGGVSERLIFPRLPIIKHLRMTHHPRIRPAFVFIFMASLPLLNGGSHSLVEGSEWRGGGVEGVSGQALHHLIHRRGNVDQSFDIVWSELSNPKIYKSVENIPTPSFLLFSF